MKNQFIFSNLYFMKKQVLFLICIFLICVSKAQTDTIIIESIPDSALVNNNTIINEDTTLEMINKEEQDTIIEISQKEITKNISSEALPPRAEHISSFNCSVVVSCLSSGRYHAAPKDLPLGTIVTLTSGEAYCNIQLTVACPAS